MYAVNALEWLNLTRHGESTGNVASIAAHEAEREENGIAQRDADIPLSDAGREQAALLGRRLAALPEDERPALVLVSPYVRTRDTARIALDQLPYAPRVRVDERLRDRDQGVLEGLTWHGIRRRFPEEAERKRRLGKFYYRAPGGESWADLALRLRSLYHEQSGRVLVVTHDAIVVMTRYLVEELTEEQVMAVEKTPVANCSLSRWRRADGRLQPVAYNDTSFLTGASAR
ncbi:histidine phosphatase family protein [Actinomadura parmotrematis]|uniref:Histidine phosphatase family protein n=1 Tax=Actinomadura parmotrematis TaxID=2864039 RepID=A0ABS7FZ99_9ACTN|nr:histidine phosphatase family protein [Actinomadura parmotrematis]MBW8485626.1 histidine phosphatase family protein [Actinomadura parmotrematis]